MNRVAMGSVGSLALIVVATVQSQSGTSPLSPVPAAQRPALTARLIAYSEAFRAKDRNALYDLVSDESKIGLDGKQRVSRSTFIRDMQDTRDLERLGKFTPFRTEPDPLGFDIYGCGEIPYGKERLVRVAAVRAVREHGDWFFDNWDYADPPEPCSRLSDTSWKPQHLRLDGPMRQVSCELF